VSVANTRPVHTEETKEAHKDNEGARALREKYPDRGGIAEVAKLCAANASAVSRWFSGERKPDSPMRARIEDKTGIDWRLFDRDVEPEAKEPAA
jgi:transcriptional regulator with XRE-family HTH domain